MLRFPSPVLCPSAQRLIAVALAAAGLAPAAAAQIAPGARAFAMGGAGVAAAEPWAAPFANPALTRFRDEGVPRGLALPYVAAAGGDPQNLFDRVDEFQDTLDQLQALLDAGDPTAAGLRPALVNQLDALDGRTLVAGAEAGVVALLPLRDITLAFSGRTYVDARAFPDVDPADFTLINDPNGTSADLDDLASRAVVQAGEVSEFALTLAYEGELGGRRFSLGMAPKYVSIDVTNYAQSVGDFDTDSAVDDVRSGANQRRAESFNADAGLALDLEEGVTLGLAVRDVLRRNIRSTGAEGEAFTYRVRPRPVGALALERGAFLFTAEADLWPARPFSNGGESQFARMGAEVEVLGLARLRAGFAHDLRDTLPDVFTFGLGSARGAGFAWDVAGALGDRALGVALQVAFAF